ncbi:MAG: CoB--CoM heterodisulfide reductase iron-sulfur subunit B family protein [Desulfobacter sp.]|nr:CoB--CoM heterodisulfide reductase iron-sulfur subunit B family protein [Desulfobacter sp.]WDP87371.1 MAG: CoB--CoM heterodisulfide reductase iron-sulfur subunit B family protein [Desulfobacter sp.]
MKSYLYYPGCSLKGTAKEYDISVTALMTSLGADLLEIDDWTCCGATAAQAVDSGIGLALGARNLALAEKNSRPDPEKEPLDILVPCSACYLNLKTAQFDLEKDKAKREGINQVLSKENLSVQTHLKVRHLLDVLSLDVDWKKGLPFSNPLEGIKVAPYYGCQCLRPFTVFDNPESPHSMDEMIQAAGAQVLDWDMGAQCCGASNATTKPDVGQYLVGKILDNAKDAHCIVTVCPMCQMNLETYQDKAHPVPVLYLPQFLGLAMGIARDRLGLELNLSENVQLTGG